MPYVEAEPKAHHTVAALSLRGDGEPELQGHAYVYAAVVGHARVERCRCAVRGAHCRQVESVVTEAHLYSQVLIIA